MARRENHYEAAFEQFLRERTVPYVAVDETRRALLGGGSLKSLDFIVTGSGPNLLVDIKGRRFPSGRRRQYWKNWSTEDDLRSLAKWQSVFGPGFEALFVFAYNVTGNMSPLPQDQLFTHRRQTYGFVGIRLCHYLAHARRISPRWETVAIPTALFRRLAAPVDTFLTAVATPPEAAREPQREIESLPCRV